MFASSHQKTIACVLVTLLVLFFLGGFLHAIVPHDHHAMSSQIDTMLLLHTFGERSSWALVCVLFLFIKIVSRDRGQSATLLWSARQDLVPRAYLDAFSRGILHTKRY